MGYESLVAIVVAAFGVLAGLLAVLALIARERRARRRFRVLSRIATVSDAGGSLQETLDDICGILVPALADFCMVDVIADREARRVAAHVGPGAPPGAERRLAQRQPSLPDRMLDGEGGGHEPRFLERLSEKDLRDLAHDDEDLAFMRELRIRSAITVPLNARGRFTGALTLGVAWSGRRYRREDLRFARILAGWVALALDNSGLFADLERAEHARAEIGEILQRGLLPPPLPNISGWSIAAMYRPAGAQNEVGGDFYDAFRLPGGWMLAIGDVTGRGAKAASITAVVRYTLRTAAALTGDPVVALAALNRALLARADAALCSLVALTLSEDPGRPLRLAVAGHPPPLLVDGDAVDELSGEGPVLGAFADADWRIAQTPLEDGQQVVVVTDGITEARGDGGRFGEQRLRAELRGGGGPTLLTRRLEGALQSFTGGDHDDDVAVLALARSGRA